MSRRGRRVARVPQLKGDAVSTVVGLRNLPEAIRSLGALANPDYVDLYTVTASEATDKSPEGWARAALEETPTGRSAPSLWRLLGLRLGPRPSPDYVQGWKIADRGDNWLRLGAASWFMTAHAVVHVAERHVCVALSLRYDRPIPALDWPPVSIIHRTAAP